MSKQDRTHSRTPADTENKFLLNLGKTFAEILGIATDARTMAEGTRSELSKSVAQINKELTDKGATIKLIVDSGIVDKDGNVQASIVISAINDQSEAQIKADNIIFEGQKLDIKVDAANIEGTLTADQIDADGIEAENVDISGKINASEGSVGDWEIGEFDVPAQVYFDGTCETHTVKKAGLYSGLRVDSTLDGVFGKYETYFLPDGVYLKSYETGKADDTEVIKHFYASWHQLIYTAIKDYL